MNAEETLSESHAQDLPWLAFLYVSDDLTPDDVVDFEERLLTDQTAREAVANAMTMIEGLRMATEMESLKSTPNTLAADFARPDRHALDPRNSSRWFSRVFSIAIAAGLAFCIGWWFANQQNAAIPQMAQPESDEKRPTTSELVGAEQLVEIWTDSQELIAGLADGAALEYSTEIADDASLQDTQEPEAFSWMLTVVATPPHAQSKVLEN